MSVLDETLTATSLAGLTIVKAGTQAPKVNMLIYGPYGAGKTVLAGSADLVPDMRKVLCLDIEGGTLSLRHTYPNVELVRITDWNSMADIYAEFRAGVHKDYGTIIVDSLTEAQQFNMNKVMDTMVEAAASEGKERSEDVASQREWYINQQQIKKMIRAFRDLPNVNVIFTALSADKVDKMSARVSTLPDLPGKLAGQVPALFDEVLYLSVQKLPDEESGGEVETRVLLAQSTGRIAAKDRSGRLPKVLLNPTMADLYTRMIGASK